MNPSHIPRRRGFLDGTWTAFVLAGMTLLRGRRGTLLLLVGALPIVPVVVAMMRSGVEIKGILGFGATVSEHYFRLVNLIICLFLGCAALGEDMEGGTLPYLLARAIPRSALLLGRYLAYLFNTSLLLGGWYCVCYVVTVGQMGSEALWVDLPFLGATLLALFLSIATYGAFFVTLTTLFRRPLLIGLGFLFLWEAWAATGPGPVADYTILHHVYVLIFHWTYLESFRELSLWEADTLPEDTTGSALTVLLGIIVVGMLLSAWRFRRKEYAP